MSTSGACDSVELPPELADWLASGAATSSWQRDFRRLKVDRVGDALLLEESHDGLHLTEREREVLALVAKGKTNPEIAEILWITPSTVRKHLENVYAKLGVRTRTAAVARFLGALDDEARRRLAGTHAPIDEDDRDSRRAEDDDRCDERDDPRASVI
jgi:DNA-binding CsgD family transcriptional regulator